MRKIYKAQQGVTMVELLISTTVGLMLTAAVAGLFIQNKNSYNQNEHISFIQDNGRYALTTLTDDLSAVDFWGGLSSIITVDSTDPDLPFAAGSTCGTAAGWEYNIANSTTYLRQPTVADVAATFPCIDNFDLGTNMLLIKRVRGLSTNALTTNGIYLRVTNLLNGAFFRQDAAQAAPTADQEDWEYFIHIYFLESDNLKRMTIASNPPTSPPSMVEETLAEGIEMFHVEFGIDANIDDNTADFFTSTPTPAQLNNAVEARVHILARADSTLPGYANSKTYQLGDLQIGANDGFLRRSYTASTPLRNVVNIR